MIPHNTTLGNITQLIINIRDERFLDINILQRHMRDHQVTMQQLKMNQHFVTGVWSGFVWPQGFEAFFWRTLLTYKDVTVKMVADAPDAALTEEQERQLDAQVSTFAMATDDIVQNNAGL